MTDGRTTSVGDLAIGGAQPAFAQPIHVGRPNVGDREALLRRIGDCLDRNWLTNNGPLVQEFESRVADYLGVRHCIAVCNATIGLEITIRAVGLAGEVLVPSYTFIATAHALDWQGIKPVFCDIDPLTHNIDPSEISRHITPLTTGIIGVHLWGRPCAVRELQAVAEEHQIKLIFDAAHAFGASYEGKRIGGFGEAEVFSFHATKFVNAFEGGAVVTNNDDIAKKIRLMTNFGFAGYDDVVYSGTNGKMTEVCAAMGLTSLDAMPDIVSRNFANYLAYQKGLAGLPGLRLIDYNGVQDCNYQYVVVEVDEDVSGLTRDEIVRILHSENVLARKYFWPGCHRMRPYRDKYPYSDAFLPATNAVAKRVMVLPTGTAIDYVSVERICRILYTALLHSADARALLVEDRQIAQ